MGDPEQDLLDYEEEDEQDQTATDGADAPLKKEVKGTYVSIHSSGFRDFLLKPELLRAIVDCGFEHPSEVQHECIPQAILGMDILCQAKSGMGKTAVFVLATLQQIDPVDGQVSVLVMCHTRELAFQISKEYERFSKYMPSIKVGVFFGGLSISNDEKVLKSNCPHIVVGTPGRILALVRNKKLNLRHIKHFILDECDKMLEQLDMRRDVQDIFRSTPHEKQVMMFSATLSKDIRPVCKKFMQDVIISHLSSLHITLSFLPALRVSRMIFINFWLEELAMSCSQHSPNLLKATSEALRENSFMFWPQSSKFVQPSLIRRKPYDPGSCLHTESWSALCSASCNSLHAVDFKIKFAAIKIQE